MSHLIIISGASTLTGTHESTVRFCSNSKSGVFCETIEIRKDRDRIRGQSQKVEWAQEVQSHIASILQIKKNSGGGGCGQQHKVNVLNTTEPAYLKSLRQKIWLYLFTTIKYWEANAHSGVLAASGFVVQESAKEQRVEDNGNMNQKARKGWILDGDCAGVARPRAAYGGG